MTKKKLRYQVRKLANSCKQTEYLLLEKSYICLL